MLLIISEDWPVVPSAYKIHLFVAELRGQCSLTDCRSKQAGVNNKKTGLDELMETSKYDTSSCIITRVLLQPDMPPSIVNICLICCEQRIHCNHGLSSTNFLRDHCVADLETARRLYMEAYQMKNWDREDCFLGVRGRNKSDGTI
ncbi:645_t:CDS:2 [Ambispora gerdemannii]|uniref:645_t:CDS:1 n=1 Tax=Ambispora gerdemannii TaxID=144530 RepID=A0A9N9DCP4_9GLOM|nr:645_t:CDS:2 [Ambispora gerdemannii]